MMGRVTRNVLGLLGAFLGIRVSIGKPAQYLTSDILYLGNIIGMTVTGLNNATKTFAPWIIWGSLQVLPPNVIDALMSLM